VSNLGNPLSSDLSLVRALLASPRRRRRLAWTFGCVLTVAAVIVLGVKYSTTGTSFESPVAPDSAAPTTAVATPKLRVTPTVRRQVGQTVQRFARTAVIRKDLASAWLLASPTMRAGVTRREWLRGDLPVQPFPAKALESADWRLRYRFERTLGIAVLVQPKKGSGAPVMVYTAELTAPGSGPPRRFLVDFLVAQETLGAASGPSEASGDGGRGDAEAAPELASERGRLGPEWFLVPAALVLLPLVLLGGFAMRGFVQRRRAERHWRELSGR
jgi:hypothetical protein